jgi:DNA polymerase-3 subunit beta
MKFSIERDRLIRPLQLLTGVVERRQTMAVLSNILVIAKAGVLEFVGTDLEVELDIRLTSAVVHQEGAVTIPARKLADIVRSFGDGVTVNFEVVNDRTIIRSGRSRFTLACLPAADFPRSEGSVADSSFEIDRVTLRGLIERVAFAMAQQDVRFFLNGMLIEVDRQHLRTVATDGHRLAMVTESMAGIAFERKSVIVPRKGVLEIMRLLEGDEPVASLIVGKSYLSLTVGTYSLTTKLVDGQFPDYEKVIPKGLTRAFLADRLSLRSTLSRVAILSNEKFRGVRFKVEPDQLLVEAQNPEREEAEETLAIEYAGSAVEIGFNVGYIQDVLGVIPEGQVRFCFTDANGSALIEGANTGDAVYVVMPMRL